MDTNGDGWPTDSSKSWNEGTSSEDELLSSHLEDGEEEAAWLIEVGMGSLVTSILENRNVTDATLAAVEQNHLTRNQIRAVQRRVETLKSTVKGRKVRSSQRRPDCRDIFRDAEPNSGGSSGRSRSATPDSLDSQSPKESRESLLNPTEWNRSEDVYPERSEPLHQVHDDGLDSYHPQHVPDISMTDGMFSNNVSLPVNFPDTTAYDYGRNPFKDHRRSSLTQLNVAENAKGSPVKIRRSGLFDSTSDGHVAIDKAGIEIVKYQVMGTLSGPRQHRSNSDPSAQTAATNSHTLHFDYEDLSEEQRIKLRQLALLELTTLFDDFGLSMISRKRERMRVRRLNKAPERNVFGTGLKKLLERDQRLQPNCQSPIIVNLIISVLDKNLKEEGLLRVSGNLQKMHSLQKLIDTTWKDNLDGRLLSTIENALKNTAVHDVAGLLKSFLRQLPESLLTKDYVDLFAQVDEIPYKTDQLKALNLLLLIIPSSNRFTLQCILQFLIRVTEHKSDNRMSVTNVATVMGPNLFPLKPSKRSSKQAINITEEMAYTAKTNRITELLLTNHETLFRIPTTLAQQLVRC